GEIIVGELLLGAGDHGINIAAVLVIDAAEFHRRGKPVQRLAVPCLAGGEARRLGDIGGDAAEIFAQRRNCRRTGRRDRLQRPDQIGEAVFGDGRQLLQGGLKRIAAARLPLQLPNREQHQRAAAFLGPVRLGINLRFERAFKRGDLAGLRRNRVALPCKAVLQIAKRGLQIEKARFQINNLALHLGARGGRRRLGGLELQKTLLLGGALLARGGKHLLLLFKPGREGGKLALHRFTESGDIFIRRAAARRRAHRQRLHLFLKRCQPLGKGGVIALHFIAKRRQRTAHVTGRTRIASRRAGEAAIDNRRRPLRQIGRRNRIKDRPEGEAETENNEERGRDEPAAR